MVDNYLESVGSLFCQTCQKKVRPKKVLTVNPADPTEAFRLACGHLVIPFYMGDD